MRRTAPKPLPYGDHIFKFGEQERPSPVRYQGVEKPPLIRLPPRHQIVVKDNPMMTVEMPTALIRRPRKPHWRDKLAVRRVTDADLPELTEWAIPRAQDVYPRATRESIMPVLRLACRGGRFAFLRTESACGLYCAEKTPWEPELNVYGVFLVSKTLRKDEDDGDDLNLLEFDETTKFKTSLAAGLQPMAILEAAYKWACEIKAVSFMFGSETRFDVSKFADRIGFDEQTHGFVKYIRKE